MEWTESLDFTRHFECAFYTVAKLPVDDAEKFCEWCLSDFSWKDEHTTEGCKGETIMMAPAAGFYTTPGSGLNQVRLAYVLCKEDIQRALFVLERALDVYKMKNESVLVRNKNNQKCSANS